MDAATSLEGLLQGLMTELETQDLHPVAVVEQDDMDLPRDALPDEEEEPEEDDIPVPEEPEELAPELPEITDALAQEFYEKLEVPDTIEVSALKSGMEAELEHWETSGESMEVVARIAVDHLLESPTYYEALAAMIADLEAEQGPTDPEEPLEEPEEPVEEPEEEEEEPTESRVQEQAGSKYAMGEVGEWDAISVNLTSDRLEFTSHDESEGPEGYDFTMKKEGNEWVVDREETSYNVQGSHVLWLIASGYKDWDEAGEKAPKRDEDVRIPDAKMFDAVKQMAEEEAASLTLGSSEGPEEARIREQAEGESENVLGLEWKYPKPVARVDQLVAEYGQPQTVADDRVIWTEGIEPFSEIRVVDEEIPHDKPKPHADYLYASMPYNVPEDKVADVEKISKSVMYDPLKQVITARCDNMAANVTSLYLAQQIADGEMTADEASEQYGDTIMKAMEDEALVQDMKGKLKPMMGELPPEDGEPEERIVNPMIGANEAKGAVKGLAKKAGRSVKKAEEIWKSVKKDYLTRNKKTEDEMTDRDWEKVTGAVKHSLGLKAGESRVSEDKGWIAFGKNHNEYVLLSEDREQFWAGNEKGWTKTYEEAKVFSSQEEAEKAAKSLGLDPYESRDKESRADELQSGMFIEGHEGDDIKEPDIPRDFDEEEFEAWQEAGGTSLADLSLEQQKKLFQEEDSGGPPADETKGRGFGSSGVSREEEMKAEGAVMDAGIKYDTKNYDIANGRLEFAQSLPGRGASADVVAVWDLKAHKLIDMEEGRVPNVTAPEADKIKDLREQGYMPLAKGLTQEDADNMAKVKDGVVSPDPENPEKFMVLVKESLWEETPSEEGPPKEDNGPRIEFRSEAEEDLWDTELLGQISDGAYENYRGSHYRHWDQLPTRVNPDLRRPRVVNSQYKNYFPFHKDLMDAVGPRMLKIVRRTMPEATSEDLRKMLVHISNAVRYPVREVRESMREGLTTTPNDVAKSGGGTFAKKGETVQAERISDESGGTTLILTNPEEGTREILQFESEQAMSDAGWKVEETKMNEEGIIPPVKQGKDEPHPIKDPIASDVDTLKDKDMEDERVKPAEMDFDEQGKMYMDAVLSTEGLPGAGPSGQEGTTESMEEADVPKVALPRGFPKLDQDTWEKAVASLHKRGTLKKGDKYNYAALIAVYRNMEAKAERETMTPTKEFRDLHGLLSGLGGPVNEQGNFAVARPDDIGTTEVRGDTYYQTYGGPGGSEPPIPEWLPSAVVEQFKQAWTDEFKAQAEAEAGEGEDLDDVMFNMSQTTYDDASGFLVVGPSMSEDFSGVDHWTVGPFKAQVKLPGSEEESAVEVWGGISGV